MSDKDCALSIESCRKARLAKDARFDGQFYVGVLTTGIYCRPICPASPPKEANVRYFDSAIKAAQAGLRPCLRCRPDSAPESNAWKGTKTTLERALKLIDAGVLVGEDAISIEQLSERLGISSRYLRKLFLQGFGASPKQYAQYRQLMFAKQLLHQTNLTMTQVGHAAGFNSVRRFNEAFKATLKLTPTELRKCQGNSSATVSAKKIVSADTTKEVTDKSEMALTREALFATQPQNPISLSLMLYYRPPLEWGRQSAFYRVRAVQGMEWIVDNKSYGRSFTAGAANGYFEAVHDGLKHRFQVEITLADDKGLAELSNIVRQIRRLLDLDADMSCIEDVLSELKPLGRAMVSGLRIPGTWSTFEAGCRAVLGQQVSIIQASSLLNQLVLAYGETRRIGGRDVRLFPTAAAIAEASLDELKMPGARKLALNALGQYVVEHPEASVEEWLSIKGIGPWTVAYTKLRGLSAPDILLCSDLVVKKRVLALYQQQEMNEVLADVDYQSLTQAIGKKISPWGSYLTFQLWNLT